MPYGLNMIVSTMCHELRVYAVLQAQTVMAGALLFATSCCCQQHSKKGGCVDANVATCGERSQFGTPS
jgi:hypothetical protein